MGVFVVKKGLFITFEGADGCGKTTQLNLLSEYLKEKGFDVVTTREPGGDDVGKKIRELVLHYKGDVSPTCEAFLYLADRAQNTDMTVKPAIDAGKIVLCDRHIDSSVAFQGYGRGLDIERIKMFNSIATSGRVPDLTLVFDVDSEIALSRVSKKWDRIEAEGIEFHKKVRYGFLEIAKEEPQRVKVVDANGSIENIFEHVKLIIEAALG